MAVSEELKAMLRPQERSALSRFAEIGAAFGRAQRPGGQSIGQTLAQNKQLRLQESQQQFTQALAIAQLQATEAAAAATQGRFESTQAGLRGRHSDTIEMQEAQLESLESNRQALRDEAQKDYALDLRKFKRESDKIRYNQELDKADREFDAIKESRELTELLQRAKEDSADRFNMSAEEIADAAAILANATSGDVEPTDARQLLSDWDAAVNVTVGGRASAAGDKPEPGTLPGLQVRRDKLNEQLRIAQAAGNAAVVSNLTKQLSEIQTAIDTKVLNLQQTVESAAARAAATAASRANALTAAQQQEPISSTFAKLSGLSATTTIAEAVAQGFFPVGNETQLSVISQRKEGFINSKVQMLALANLVIEEKSAFGAVGTIARTISNVSSEAKRMMELFGDVPTDKVAAYESIFTDLGITNSIERSALMDLAFSVARSREEGGRFSKNDIDLALVSLGRNWGNPVIFAATIRSMAGRQDDSYDAMMTVFLGQPSNRSLQGEIDDMIIGIYKRRGLSGLSDAHMSALSPEGAAEIRAAQ